MPTDYDHLIDVIRLEEELVLPGPKRSKLKEGSREWRRRERMKKLKLDKRIEAIHSRKQAQKRYYEKNKEELNRKRAMRNIAPEYVYNKAKNRAKANGHEWDFTLETWAEVWTSAPRVVNRATGLLVAAWAVKGPNHATDAQMVRRDTSKGWSPENCVIAYRGEYLEY